MNGIDFDQDARTVILGSCRSSEEEELSMEQLSKKVFTALLAAFLLGGVARAQESEGAAKVSCAPVKRDTLWHKGEVGYSSGLQQVLYHFTATGSYMVVDLICNFDQCAGFFNGSMVTGKIEFSRQGEFKVSAVEFTLPPAKEAVRFTCL